MKNTKRSFATSLVALLLCFSMLLGTTYAWFTDSAISGSNVITSGNLDVEMYYSEDWIDANSEAWINADGKPIFTYDNWEPGYTDVKYIKVKNLGNLALKWMISIKAESEVNELADVIDVYYVNPATEALESLENKTSVGILSSVLEMNKSTSGVLLPAGETSELYADGETILAIAFHMHEKAGNEYQGKSVGDGFSVTLIATQFSYESDAFNNEYDKDAEWPNTVIVGGNSATANVTTADNKVSNAVSLLSTDGMINANVPAGVKVNENTSKLTLRISDVANSKANIALSQTEASLSIDVHIDGVAADNDVVMAIGIKELLPKALNMGNYRFYHVENGQTVEMKLLDNGATPVHNDYEYDPVTGDVVLYLRSFSEVALVADKENAWEGKFDYTWYVADATELTIANADQLAAFGAIVGGMAQGIERDSFEGKTVKLLADINLGDKEAENNSNIIFYPIGYFNSAYSYEKVSGGSVSSTVYSFEGTFDGNGNTIANFYQNTWEMFGDYNDGYSGTPNHYKDAMGLFGYVVGGTIKNLTVSNFSSDGEFTPTGVIAAYAVNSTFENIAITNCNPRVYNTGNGGIVGIAGNSNDKDTNIELTNITVDNSNTISALWGSWDVACGGLVGMFRGNADSGNGKILFKNCHVAAQIDVYNDVCANYQYYAYRYAGMIIGSIRHNTKDENGRTIPNMTGISAKDCTVHFGTWNDYYYCEFEKNSMASYSEDYQFSRVPHSELNFTDSNENGIIDTDEEKLSVTGCKHEHTAEENHQAIYLPFYNLFTGYGWGVSSMGIDNWNGITKLDVTTGDHDTSVEKFEGKVTELVNSKTYTLGDIFTLLEDSGIKLIPGALTVSVTNLDENNPVSATIVYDRENWDNTTITFSGVGKVKITIQDYFFCTPTAIEVTITERQPVEKFVTKFTNDYLYRVGNASGSTVALGTLFAAKDGATIATDKVTVSFETLAGNATGSSFTANALDWTKGTIQFIGTGIVKVTITDADYCVAMELTLEVVNAVNATSAMSAKSNNVVLLNDVGLYTIEVSNGYTLYGNGFKMTATSDPMYDTMRAGFVTLDNGTLDNVQIICPNFSYAIIYNSQIRDSANTVKPADDSNDARGNVRSAVMATGNSTIVNSYIHGGRAAIFLRSGKLLVDGSTISGGAAANIHALSAQSLTLRNATLIQKPFKDNVHGTGKTLMGFSVLLECGGDGYSTPVILEGTLVQDAWINKDYVKYTPENASSIVENALSKTAYLHDLDGDGKNESLNLGFTYIPEEVNGNTKTDNIEDNRTNDSTVPYSEVNVGTVLASAKVYSYENTNGTMDEFKNVGNYVPTKQGATAPTVSFTDTNADREFETKFDANDGRWESALTVNLDNGNYTFSWDKLLVQKYGVNLTYTVETADGTVVDTTKTIALTTSGVVEYVLTVTDGDATHTIYFSITASKTSIPDPVVADMTGGTPLLVVKSKNSDWSCALPALEQIKVKYYTADGEVILDLATLTPTSTGKQNGTSNYWTITKDGYTLKVTCGVIHDTKSVYGMPVVVDNNGTKQLYFTISSTNGYVSTGTSARSVTLTYEFTDPNGKTLTFTKNWNFKYADYKDVAQYSYSDFVNGTMTDLLTSSSSGSGSCVTPDTLVTLANGTQVRVDSLTGSEELLVWNMETGKLDKAPIMFVDSDPTAEYEIVHLYFSDGTDVKVIYEHGFWDYDLNRYVYLDKNAADYIGHTFAKQNGDSLEMVTLIDVVIETETTMAWSPVTAGHLCYFVNGMLSMPGGVGGLFNIFDVDAETMTYDLEAMQRDIDTYGLYTYEELNAICPLSEDMFNAAGGAFLKISIGKGNLTEDELFDMINRYSKFFE